jgi:hypothetical protein
MPPTALLEEAKPTEQMFYAQCVDCSNKQGVIVRKNKALVGLWAPIKYFRSQVLNGRILLSRAYISVFCEFSVPLAATSFHSFLF